MKQKGSNAERELVAMLWQAGWSAARVAGSGSMKFPSPDVIAGKGGRKVVVECKSTKNPHQYIDDEQIQQLLTFAASFGAEPMIGVKFSTEWHFFHPDDLQRTKRGRVVIHKERHAKLAKKFEDVFYLPNADSTS